ncbi:hypothetical protein BpHYR1_021852 [Brachionus plicatilis]|uniref:Uncharacterized protein n=1 Tax=Brachionus plicatilis TaxID=10195 RepID=A0A3M7T3Z9_BRAPC|nr:hypothetical protein BpHYR1_021852 [Brachionus plicatilis]
MERVDSITLLQIFEYLLSRAKNKFSSTNSIAWLLLFCLFNRIYRYLKSLNTQTLKSLLIVRQKIPDQIFKII